MSPADTPPAATERDDLRMEVAIQTMKDVLYRFQEMGEGSRSVYEVLGFLVQDLIQEGLCPNCLNDLVTHAFNETGADVTQHIDGHTDEKESVFH